ncbi:hypothetical protein FKP32DRAFT_1588703 [Trametes sanguinea]|nr:hypothetical protein FKP32DRAFT_1588703 [Trametes sanguinea]
MPDQRPHLQTRTLRAFASLCSPTTHLAGVFRRRRSVRGFRRRIQKTLSSVQAGISGDPERHAQRKLVSMCERAHRLVVAIMQVEHLPQAPCISSPSAFEHTLLDCYSVQGLCHTGVAAQSDRPDVFEASFQDFRNRVPLIALVLIGRSIESQLPCATSSQL